MHLRLVFLESKENFCMENVSPTQDARRPERLIYFIFYISALRENFYILKISIFFPCCVIFLYIAFIANIAKD